MGFFNFIGGLFGLAGAPTQRIQVQKSPASSGLNIIYGRRRIEPVTVFKIASGKNMAISNTAAYDDYRAAYDASRDNNKDENNWLHRIDVWGQGEITAIERFWIDGDVSTAKRFRKRPYFRAASKFGTAAQAAATELVNGDSEWAASHTGNGVAYTWARFFNSGKYPEFKGEPGLDALVKGIRVYDPRDEAQSFTDPATWTFSNNTALVVLNYIMAVYGFNAGQHEIDLSSFAEAADLCDERVTIPAVPKNTAATTYQNYYDRIYGEWVNVLPGEVFPAEQPWQQGTTRARYTTDVVLDPKNGVIENLKILLKGLGWALPWSNGKLKLVIETEGKTPVMAFDEDSMLGEWTIESGKRAERWNRVTIEFPNANKDFEQDTVSWPKLDSDTYAAYLEEDAGEGLHKIENIPTITSAYAAETFAEYFVRKSRVNPRITGLKLTAKALLLEPGDVISLSHADKGFSNSPFLVEKVTVSAQLDVTVDLIAYVESVYDPSIVDEEPIRDLPYGPELWEDPTAITDIELSGVHETNADGSVVHGLFANWDAPMASVGVAYYELFWRKTAELPALGEGATYTATDFPNKMMLLSTSTEAKISGLVDNTDYTVGIRYTTGAGKTSDIFWQDIFVYSTATKLDSIEEGATRTRPRGTYSDSATYYPGDIVQWENGSYIFIADGNASGIEPDDDEYWQEMAVSGGYKDYIYRRASSQPSRPSGNNPGGWSDGIPAENGNPAWESWAWRTASGDVNGVWSSPVNIASPVYERQYSENGSSGWHTTPTEDDRWFRERPAGTGSWSDPVQLKGEGALSDLDTVDTEDIEDRAVTSSGYSSSTHSELYLPLDTNKQRGSVSVDTYNTQTDQIIVQVEFKVVITGGKANFQPYIEYGSGSQNVAFFTEQSHTTSSSADKFASKAAVTRLVGNQIQPPFKFGIRVNYYSSGCAAYLKNVTMVAFALKR